MKNFSLTLLFAFVLTCGLNAQAQKIFVKSFPIETASVLELQLPGESTVEEWEKDFIRISVTVDLLNSSEEVLKRLATLGRYDLQIRYEGTSVFAALPKMKQTVSLKGEELKEQVQVKIYAPAGFSVLINNEQTQQTADSI